MERKEGEVLIKRKIKKSNIIATIIMTIVTFFVVIYFSDFSIKINGVSYYILNQSVIPQTIILFGLLTLLNIIVQVLLFKHDGFTKPLILFNLFVQLIGIVISYYLIVDLKLFNFIEIWSSKEFYSDIYFGITVVTIIITVATIAGGIFHFFKNNK